MKTRNRLFVLLVTAILTVGPLLAGCATPATEPPTETAVEQVEQATDTPVPPTPTPEGPTVGGKLVWYVPAEPNSLDPHMAIWVTVPNLLGGALVALDPDGNYVPYLAEKWTVSDDGLTYDFTLKDGITFNDGTPLTAADYAWTFQRLLDPEAPAMGAKSLLGPLASAEAVDDSTLRLTLAAPHAPFLFSLCISGFYQPLSQAAVEAGGDDYGRNPVGVGPYKLKEWKTGEKITLERNPDYNWGPAYAHEGPYYIQEIEFRFIAEESTAMAGLETGEIDYAKVPADQLDQIANTGKFQIYESLVPGLSPYLLLNNSKPPFDDLKVRQALNLAVDRDVLVSVVAQGKAVAQYGPMSSSTFGYWSGIEELGYHFDQERAKTLLAEAGYTLNADGVLEKDGQPLVLPILVSSEGGETFVRTAEVLKEQYKAVGIQVEIEQVETATLMTDLATGNYTISMQDLNYPEADLLFLMYHSSMIGYVNMGFVNNPDLDAVLMQTRLATDPAARQEALTQAQKMITENAYVVPLFARKQFQAVANKVKGYVFSEKTAGLYGGYLDDAYIVE